MHPGGSEFDTPRIKVFKTILFIKRNLTECDFLMLINKILYDHYYRSFEILQLKKKLQK